MVGCSRRACGLPVDRGPSSVSAATVALLASENATLDAAWNDALDELRQSRARIVTAADRERRKLERALHDGVQQRLVAVRINLGIAGESDADESVIFSKLDGIGDSVEHAIDELRAIAHGLYPPVLSQQGLLDALEHVRGHAATPIAIHASGIGRHSAELEAAAYYCCVEAIQNATKHGGPAVQISVARREDEDTLSFKVTDDGAGFDPSDAHEGTGLQNMRDRGRRTRRPRLDRHQSRPRHRRLGLHSAAPGDRPQLCPGREQNAGRPGRKDRRARLRASSAARATIQFVLRPAMDRTPRRAPLP